MTGSFLKIVILFFVFCFSCSNTKNKPEKIKTMKAWPILDIEEAYHLTTLPLNCLKVEYPNKPGSVLGSDADLKSPHVIHPAFYGCFDWHSAVHGHWVLVNLLRKFPEIKNRDEILTLLTTQLTAENILTEKEFFSDPNNLTFERTYGWAWLLKLAEELYRWEDPAGERLFTHLLPLTELIEHSYMDYLPRLVYPVRTGEHSNSAFGLKFAYDFAAATGKKDLLDRIERKARDLYLADTNCPLAYEPGGHDFLSPCLEEADLMRRVLSGQDFKSWLDRFLPDIRHPDFYIQPGKILDRTDGKLVHLDGLNFSRAGILYGIVNSIPEYGHLLHLADEHFNYSLPNLTNDHYEGSHWLATFALYAFNEAQKVR